MTVELDSRRVELDGLVDTGNLLRDPLSGRPVICADRRLLSGLLSPGLARAMEDSQRATSLSPADAKRLRLIPAGSATGHGILTGFVPDQILISYIHRNKEQQREVNAVIASAELTDTHAIVPAELID